MPETSHMNWYKSSYSGGRTQDCVEVADLSQGRAVRDSQHPDLGHLAFSATEWSAFVDAARSGEL